MVTLSKLYKQTSTGSIQVWWQEIEGNKYRTCSGINGGKIVTSAWTEVEGKNIGRSNETTPSEQAVAEVESTYTLKRKKGYRYSPETAETEVRFQPMLAKKFDEYKNRLFAFGRIFSQPKYDGVRCIAKRGENALYSREGNLLVSVPHILKSVNEFFENNPRVMVLDGELYNHKFKEDFNRIISLVKKTKPTTSDIEDSKNLIQYHVYDCIKQNNSETFGNRFDLKHFEASNSSSIVFSQTQQVVDNDDLNSLYSKYLDEGFEGQIIRFDTPYEQKRTSNLLKRKEFQDAEFTILNILEGSGNGAGYAKRAICSLPNGETFTADIVGTQEILKNYLERKNNFIGLQATIVFFALTPGGVPRFPKLKVINQKHWG